MLYLFSAYATIMLNLDEVLTLLFEINYVTSPKSNYRKTLYLILDTLQRSLGQGQDSSSHHARYT